MTPTGRGKNSYIFAPERRRQERRHLLRRILLIGIPLLIAIFFTLNIIVSRQVKLERISVTVLNLPSDLESYSILHISDLHGAELGEHQKTIQAALGSTRYSCVVMTGDMLGKDGDVEPLLDLVALLSPDKPIYYIPGDMDGSFIDSFAHDSLSVYTPWAQKLADAGVTLLDVPVSETRNKGTIWFIPEDLYTLDLDSAEAIYRGQLSAMNQNATSLTADDAALRRAVEYQIHRIETVRELRERIAPEDMQVVLTHTPLSERYIHECFNLSGKTDYFSMRYAGLILAGHYNGGQWRLPGAGPVYVPEMGWFPEDSEVQGLSFPAGIPQYISPGLGSDPHYTWQPGRVFNRPTITLITLTRNAV